MIAALASEGKIDNLIRDIPDNYHPSAILIANHTVSSLHPHHCQAIDRQLQREGAVIQFPDLGLAQF